MRGMSRREAKTVPVHELPTVLVVGCSREFVDRCRDGAAMTGAIVRTTDLHGVESMAATCHPLAIILTDASYAQSRPVFDGLSSGAQSTLVRVPDEQIPQPDLERMIVGAVKDARRARAPA